MSDPALPFNVRQVRIRMHHTDAMGAVYHGTYFPLFDEARTEVFRDLGYTWRDAVEGEGRAMVIVHVACDFKRPARMDDLVAIEVHVARLTRVRLAFRYTVTLAYSGALVATGEQTFVFLSTTTNRPTSVPPNLAACILGAPGFVAEAGPGDAPV